MLFNILAFCIGFLLPITLLGFFALGTWQWRARQDYG